MIFRFHRPLFFVFAALTALVLVASGLSISKPSLPVQPGEIHFYSNQMGDDLRLVFQEAFKNAHNTLDISIFNFSDRKLINSLKEAEKRGVTVTLFADQSAYPFLKKIFKKTFKDPGIKGLMHRKIVLVDDHLALIGSTNFTKESLQIHENIVLALDSPPLCQALFEEKGGGRSYVFSNQTVDLWLLPQDKEAEDEMIHLISSAQKSLKVAMFTFTSQRFVESLIAAHKRGVVVELALDHKSCEGTSRKIAKILQEEGLPVFHNQGPGLLHHKFALIDDEILIVGSANWTVGAFKKNAEVILVLRPLNKEQQLFFDTLWSILTLPSKRQDELAYGS